MSAWRPMLRRARRLAIRSPWRTVSTGFLVLAAVAAGTVFMASAWGHHQRTVDPAAEFGSADVLYRVVTGLDAAAVVDALPGGSDVAQVTTYEGFQSQGDLGAGLVIARQAPWSDDLLDGLLDLVEGRLPGPGETVVSPRLADQLGLRVGDPLRFTRPRADLEVVGIGQVGDVGDDSVAVAPDEFRPVDASNGGGAPTAISVLAALPAGTEAPVVDPPGGGAGTVDGPIVRAATAVPVGMGPVDPAPAPLEPLVGIILGIALLVALTGGAAFGIGAARRLRASGILASNGADDGQLRVAAAAEALVVGVPGAALGLVVGAVAAPVWVGLRLPGWTALVDASVPWAWALAMSVLAVAGACGGAIWFSRSVRSAPTPFLLDGRPTPGRPKQRIGSAVALAVGAVAAIWSLTLGARYAVGGSLVLGVVILLWALVALAALGAARGLLSRDVIGRLVAKDLLRRPMGSVAAVTVVSIWVFVAVTGTATEWFRLSTTEDRESSTGSPTTTVFPTTVPPSTGADAPSGTPTADAPDAPDGSTGDTAGAGVFIRASGPSDLVQEGGPPAVEPLPPALVSELESVGLDTRPVTVGRWTGPCSACPQGWIPSVAVLETAEGSGLPPGTVALLESGAAVTQFNISGIEQQTVAGVPVRVGDLQLGVDAALLRSSAVEGSQLTDPQPALIGSTEGLSDRQVEEVVRVLGEAGVSVNAWDQRVVDRLGWSDSLVGSDPPVGNLLAWLVVLVLVTLAATAAHRREHGEAARVLDVLGAGPRSARRLSSLTAGTLAAVGVAVGLAGTTLALVLTVLSRTADRKPLPVLWTREATLVLIASLVVPVVIAVLARLIPPARPSAEAAAPA